MAYSTAIFYQPPTSVFTLRQAGRRLYRLGQKKRVNLFYLAYVGAQESLLAWVGEKVRQSLLFEGGVLEDGDLPIGDDPLEVALKAFLGEVRKLDESKGLLFETPSTPSLPKGQAVAIPLFPLEEVPLAKESRGRRRAKGQSQGGGGVQGTLF